MHHLMVEYYSFGDVGQGYVPTMGRHPNDLVTSFYMRTPSDILVEYGWGGREVDDAAWQAKEMTTVARFWGHHGLFEALGHDEPPPTPATQVIRAPAPNVQGNYHRMRGVCPWWDSLDIPS